MSEIQMVEQAINEFNQDREATHLISNVCISLHTKEAAERLFNFIDANGYTEASRVTAEMKSPEIFDEKVRAKTVEL